MSIKTRKKTNKEYEAIWKAFKEVSSDFEAYMGYGIKQINKIGYKKFIDFMDWVSPEDVKRYRSDRIKVVPCSECGTEFATFQIDYGLCEKCQEKFDLEEFGKMISAAESQEKGSSAAYEILFSLQKEFRNFFRKNKTLKEVISEIIEVDQLSGPYSMNGITSRILSNKENESYFIYRGEVLITDKESNLYQRYLKVKEILLSDMELYEKTEELKQMFTERV